MKSFGKYVDAAKSILMIILCIIGIGVILVTDLFVIKYITGDNVATAVIIATFGVSVGAVLFTYALVKYMSTQNIEGDESKIKRIKAENELLKKQNTTLTEEKEHLLKFAPQVISINQMARVVFLSERMRFWDFNENIISEDDGEKGKIFDNDPTQMIYQGIMWVSCVKDYYIDLNQVKVCRKGRKLIFDKNLPIGCFLRDEKEDEIIVDYKISQVVEEKWDYKEGCDRNRGELKKRQIRETSKDEYIQYTVGHKKIVKDALKLMNEEDRQKYQQLVQTHIKSLFMNSGYIISFENVNDNKTILLPELIAEHNKELEMLYNE